MPQNAGSFGSILFIVPEILKISVKQSAGYIELPMINGYPRIHWVGDPLDSIDVDFRFSSMPGIGYNVSAKAKLDLLRTERGSTTPKTLTLGNENFGDYLVKDINWEIISQAGNMKPIVIGAQVSFLANPV